MNIRCVGLIVGCFSVGAMAQSSLPPGAAQSGGVALLAPVPDGSTDNGYLPSSERRPSAQHVLSATDHDIYSRALDAADRGDWIGAKGLAAQGHDAIASRLVQWRYVLDKNSGASFAEIDGFLRNNPDWPLRDTLFSRAEVAMDQALAPQAVVSWFANRQPLTGIGMVRLGEAMIAVGRGSDGREMVQRGWVSGNFRPDQELAIVLRDGALLTPDVDRARLNNLISRDDITAARRELSRVDANGRLIAQARLAFRTSRAQGEALVARLPSALAADPELSFDRARAARRAMDNATAATLLGQPTLKAFSFAYPERWWGEANLVARGLLLLGDAKGAYLVVDNSNLASGNEFAECEFLAGWIALRYLKSPQRALAHFKKLEAGVSRPISLARARYWQARSYEALGDAASAVTAYRLAAQAPDTFYGQLALARIETSPVLHLSDAVIAENLDRPSFEADELARAIRVLAELGQESILRVFALREQEIHPNPPWVKALAQMLTDLGFREVALRVAKTASYSGLTMLQYAYPVVPVPAYVGPNSAPSPAMVLGLIRQETEFDPDAVSRAGARGLMQLMPGSAQTDATRAGLMYRPNDLTADPAYNVQLGTVEFSGYVFGFGGSFVLSIASYNAGQGNVKKWIASYGDPRLPGTDPLDWIESIPFNETRNYVMRVIENTQIYRNQLARRDQTLRILNDLYAPLSPPMHQLSADPR